MSTSEIFDIQLFKFIFDYYKEKTLKLNFNTIKIIYDLITFDGNVKKMESIDEESLKALKQDQQLIEALYKEALAEKAEKEKSNPKSTLHESSHNQVLRYDPSNGFTKTDR